MTTAPSGGVVPGLSIEQLLEAVPGLADLDLEIDVVNFRSRPGASLTFDDLSELAATIRTFLAGGAHGVVITQGTDTIEETSYFLDVLHHQPQPLVVTGAMRNPTLAGADGPANLLAAIRVAASTSTVGFGCLVVLNDEIHAAARVRKTHATDVATFASPNGGPIGYVIEGTPRMLQTSVCRYSVTGHVQTRQLRVGLTTAVFGDDGQSLTATAAGLDGLIVAAFGAGHVPESWVQPLTKIAARIPVILASRTGAGSVLSDTYGFSGSERDLIRRGLIPAGLLHPLKARILLYTLLAAGADTATCRQAFSAAGGLGDPAAWPFPANVAPPHWAADEPPIRSP